MQRLSNWTILALALIAAPACARLGTPPPAASKNLAQAALRMQKGGAPFQVGLASWYGREFQGLETSSGEPYDMYAMTAAHRQLPFGTMVRVTNLLNHRSVVIRINDRGPVPAGRIIDLSYAAAKVLRFDGLAPVRINVVSPPRLVLPVSSTPAGATP